MFGHKYFSMMIIGIGLYCNSILNSSYMTYNVSSGTLNLPHSLTHTKFKIDNKIGKHKAQLLVYNHTFLQQNTNFNILHHSSESGA